MKYGEAMAGRPVKAQAVSSCTKFMCFPVMFLCQGGFPVQAVHVATCGPLYVSLISLVMFSVSCSAPR